MSFKYREILYANYHTNQSGRAGETDLYSLFSRERVQFSKEIIPHLDSLPRAASILDIGCGSGSLIAALKDKGFSRIVGMDLSEEQVSIAHKMGIVEVQLADAFDFLRSSNEQFDVITGMDIIEHFSKDELVDILQLIRSRLKPGAVTLFRTPNLDAPFASVFAYGDFTHETFLNASSAQQVFLATGFSSVRVYSSHMHVKGSFKKFLRRILVTIHLFFYESQLFASGRSTKNIVFSPNLIIVANNQ